MQKYNAFLSTHIIYLSLVGHIPSKKNVCVPFYYFIEMFGKCNYTEKTTNKCNLGQFRKQRKLHEKYIKNSSFKYLWGQELSIFALEILNYQLIGWSSALDHALRNTLRHFTIILLNSIILCTYLKMLQLIREPNPI